MAKSNEEQVVNRLTDLEESVDFLLEAQGGANAAIMKAYLKENPHLLRALSAFEHGKSQKQMAIDLGVQQPAISKALKQLVKKRILAPEVGQVTGSYRLTKMAIVFRLQEFACELSAKVAE